MNDRFKFRVWNGTEMHYNDFVVTATGYVGKITEEFLGRCVFNQEDLTADKECTLMQSTGLKDKNGKLIYEGDIIYSPSWWWGACFVYLDIGKCGPCKGDSVMSYILAKNIDNPLANAIYNIWDGSEVEVIGNIYENKELLNDTSYR